MITWTSEYVLWDRFHVVVRVGRHDAHHNIRRIWRDFRSDSATGGRGLERIDIDLTSGSSDVLNRCLGDTGIATLKACVGLLCKNLHDRFVFLHAGSLGGPDGVTAFVGPSGCGKTTYAMAGALQGFSWMGDEYLPIELSSGLAFPLPTRLKIRSVTRRWLERLHPRAAAGLRHAVPDEPCGSACEGLVAFRNPSPHDLGFTIQTEPGALKRIYWLGGESKTVPLRWIASSFYTGGPSYHEHARRVAELASSVEFITMNPLDLRRTEEGSGVEGGAGQLIQAFV